MDKELDSRITGIEQQIQSFTSTWAAAILAYLESDLDRNPLDAILAPGLDLINRGGKRWRPLLMLLCCELAGGGEAALPYTPIVEIAHNGTLIADDIEDNAAIRRGGQAIHLKYGLDLALNAGNFMCFLPSLLIDQGDLQPAVKLLLYKYYLEDLRLLHIGQGLDIQWHTNHEYFPTKDEYFLMCGLKTGTLARMAARLGILIGGGSEELANYTGKVCTDFGVGFQVIDDVKNLATGNPGKKRGDDIIEGKKSLPVILLAGKDSAGSRRVAEIFRKISQMQAAEQDKYIGEAIEILQAAGCITEARQTALDMIARARQCIMDAFPLSEARTLLLRIFMKLS